MLLLALATASPAAVQQPASCTGGWTAFGADEANTGQASSGLGGDLALAWEFAAGGALLSTPVVAGGRLVFGDGGGTVFCLDPITGAVLWDVPAGDAVESSPAFIPPGGGSPHGKVVLGTNSGLVLCLDMEDGSQLWNVTTGGYVKSSPCFVPDPAGYSGRLYVGSYDGAVYCLDSDDGKELWRFPGCDRIHPGPAHMDGNIIFGACDGQLYSIDADDGTRLWNYSADYFPGSAAVADGRVFAGSNSGILHCVDLEDGELLWDFDLNGSVFSTPAVGDGVVYMGSDGSEMFAINASDGDELWSVKTGGRIAAPPVIAGDSLVFGDGSGELRVLSRADGGELFSDEVEGGIEAGAAVTGGMLFVGTTDGDIHAYTDGTAVSPATPAAASVDTSGTGMVLEASGGVGALKDVCSVEVRLDGGDWVEAAGTESWTATFDIADDPAGGFDHTVEYRVHTPLGTFAGNMTEVDVDPGDTMPPSVEIVSPEAGAAVGGIVVIEGTAEDETNLTGVWVRVEGGDWVRAQGGEEWSYVWDTGEYAEGEYTVQVRADDGVNMNSTSRSFVVEREEEDGAGPAGGLLMWVLVLGVLGIIIGYSYARYRARWEEEENGGKKMEKENEKEDGDDGRGGKAGRGGKTGKGGPGVGAVGRTARQR
jgi:outer membrane protein assembly factor BamB